MLTELALRAAEGRAVGGKEHRAGGGRALVDDDDILGHSPVRSSARTEPGSLPVSFPARCRKKDLSTRSARYGTEMYSAVAFDRRWPGEVVEPSEAPSLSPG